MGKRKSRFPERKRFNGEYYSLYNTYSKKSEAEYDVRHLHLNGYKARKFHSLRRHSPDRGGLVGETHRWATYSRRE